MQYKTIDKRLFLTVHPSCYRLVSVAVVLCYCRVIGVDMRQGDNTKDACCRRIVLSGATTVTQLYDRVGAMAPLSHHSCPFSLELQEGGFLRLTCLLCSLLCRNTTRVIFCFLDTFPRLNDINHMVRCTGEVGG